MNDRHFHHSPHLALTSILALGLLGASLTPDRPSGYSSRGYVPPKVRDKKRRRREIADASRRRNRK